MAGTWRTRFEPRTEQPTDGADLAFNPRLPRPAFVHIGSIPRRDLVSGRFGAHPATDAFKPSRHGPALRTARSATGGVSFGTWQPLRGDRWTILALANPPADGNIHALYSQRTPTELSQPNPGLLFGASLGNAFGGRSGGLGISCQTVNAYPNIVGAQSNSTSLIDGRFHVFVVRRAGSTAYPELFFDGAALASTNFANGAVATFYHPGMETKVGAIGGYTADSTYSSACDLPLVVAWADYLSDEDIKRLGRDPSAAWRVFADRPVRVFMPAAGIAGSASITLDGASLAGTGALAIRGSAAVTLDGATLAANSTLRISGSLAATLADATLSGSGVLPATGSLVATLDPATLDAAGSLRVSGSLTSLLDGATVTAAGALGIKGALAATLEPATLAAAGTLVGQGSGALSATLADATLTATGALRIAGSASIALDGATLSAAGALGLRASLNATLAPATLTAAGTQGAVAIGSLSAMLEPATLEGTGRLSIRGAAGATLDGATLAASGRLLLAGSASVTLAGCTIVATGARPITGSLSVTLAGATLSAHGAQITPSEGESAAWAFVVPPRDLRFAVAARDLRFRKEVP